MSEGHIQRLLLAESDFDAAQSFRAVAEEALKLYAVGLEPATDQGIFTPSPAYRAWATAKRELKELNRVCLRHAARRLDAASAGGRDDARAVGERGRRAVEGAAR